MRQARWILVLGAVALSGCGAGPFRAPQAPAPSGTAAALPEGAAPAPGTAAAPPPETARTQEEFDTTSAEERRAAAAPGPTDGDAAEVALGTTIASLGDPASPGFWAETPLVQSVRPGRLSYPGTGRSVQVELRPSGGAPGSGTRVSLPAMRVLEAPLTALPELTVTGL